VEFPHRFPGGAEAGMMGRNQRSWKPQRVGMQMAKKRKAKTPSIKKRSGELDFGKPHPVFSKMATEELKALGDEEVPEHLVNHWRMEIQEREELLDPKYLRYLGPESQFGPILKHPLYVGHINLDRAAFVNWVIPYKQRVIDGLIAEGRLKEAVFSHETMFLDEIFRKYLKQFDDKNYWKMISIIWTQQEQLWPKRKWFLQLFKSPRSQRDHLMSAAEHRKLKSLPPTFQIYRGFIGKRGEGLSWSLDRTKAEWFARRFSVLTHLGKPQLMTGTIKKKDVLAYFNARKEKEIVADPATVRSLKVTPVTPLTVEDEESEE
jgi:hypothetical protein